MLADHDSMPTLAVTDLARARQFYEEVLGFVAQSDVADGVVYRAGSTSFLVYPSSFAGTNRATAISFQVPSDRFDAEVQALRDHGLSFQAFEAPGIDWLDGVASWGEGRSLWFEDPDGNILNVETSEPA